MRRKAGLLLLVLCCGGYSTAARAITLALVPTNSPQPIGATLSVDIVATGLGDGAAPSIGSFDLDVVFDSSVLAYLGTSFGGLLGTPAVQTINSAGLSGGGVVDLFELSLLLPAQLDALQGSSVLLATLEFQGLAGGESPLTFSQSLVGDGFGAPLPVTDLGSSVHVVPEPSTGLLAALGLLALIHRSRRP